MQANMTVAQINIMYKFHILYYRVEKANKKKKQFSNEYLDQLIKLVVREGLNYVY